MPRNRPRGLAPWNPTAPSRGLVDAVTVVLDEYEAQLPLTLRQVFYRLVASTGYGKTEQSYERLGEIVNRGRRAGLIPFELIRDDGVSSQIPRMYESVEDFLEEMQIDAAAFNVDRQEQQEQYLELWVEAAGMVPLAWSVASIFGVPVYSSGGFDSTTAKYDAACRLMERDVKTVVLHVGDYDASGVSLFNAAAEDVTAMVSDLGGRLLPDFERIAITREQIDAYALETAPPKKTDKRAGFTDIITVQAEAFAPDELQAVMRAAIESWLDLGLYEQALARETNQRAELLKRVQEGDPDEDGKP